jgi:DNA (cytosine-5)-methyltransferase 1
VGLFILGRGVRYFKMAKKKPRLLDLFCGAGGASMGYHRAGFEVVGVDINPQPHYPFEFYRGDALSFLGTMTAGMENSFLGKIDAVHASPPCQGYSSTFRINKNTHPYMIMATRTLLDTSWRPWIIENVPGAPLVKPIELCGAMFDLRVYRHRLFEANFKLSAPKHPDHIYPQTKMGRKPKKGHFIHVVGNFSGVDYAKTAMGIDWMNRNELSQAIPPAYTEFIGKQLMEYLKGSEVGK